MDFYQWLYDVPGNVQGIVVAENEIDAKEKVVSYLNSKFNHCGEQLIYVRWRGPVSDDVCMIEEM